jgi:hypothetical protein
MQREAEIVHCTSLIARARMPVSTMASYLLAGHFFCDEVKHFLKAEMFGCVEGASAQYKETHGQKQVCDK